MVCETKGLTYKEVEKLPHYFGHVSVDKLEQLTKNSERLDSRTKGYIEEVKERCGSCLGFKGI